MRLAQKGVILYAKVALLGTALLFPGTMAAQAVSLNEAIELAISTNPDIGIVASNREAVDEELKQARGLYLPQIDLALGIGKEGTNDRTTRGSGRSDTLYLPRQEASVTLQPRLLGGLETDRTSDEGLARLWVKALERTGESAE